MRTVWIDVPIEPEDVLRELSDEDVIAELKTRGIGVAALGASEDLIERALSELKRGDVAEAILVLERALYPKFNAVADCIKHLADIKKKARDAVEGAQ